MIWKVALGALIFLCLLVSYAAIKACSMADEIERQIWESEENEQM